MKESWDMPIICPNVLQRYAIGTARCDTPPQDGWCFFSSHHISFHTLIWKVAKEMRWVMQTMIKLHINGWVIFTKMWPIQFSFHSWIYRIHTNILTFYSICPTNTLECLEWWMNFRVVGRGWGVGRGKTERPWPGSQTHFCRHFHFVVESETIQRSIQAKRTCHWVIKILVWEARQADHQQTGSQRPRPSALGQLESVCSHSVLAWPKMDCPVS